MAKIIGIAVLVLIAIVAFGFSVLVAAGGRADGVTDQFNNAASILGAIVAVAAVIGALWLGLS